MTDRPSVVVVGAGLGGLTAAYRLQQAGFAVQVLERAHGPGGRVQTISRNGYIFDQGADAITDGYDDYIALARDVGIGDRLVPARPYIGMIRDGRIIELDCSRMTSMAMTPLLSWHAKLQLLRGVLRLKRQPRVRVIAKMHEVAHLDDPETSAAMLSRRLFGEEAATYLIDPVTKLFNGTSAARCSLLDVHISLVAASHKPMTLRGGQAALPQALAAQLSVQYGVTVVSVTTDAQGKVVVRYGDDDQQLRQLHADGCVIATQYDSAEAMHLELAQIWPQVGRGVQPMALLKIQLAYRTPTRAKAYVVQVPDVEDPDLYCLFLDHNKCSDRAPQGCSLITVYTSNEATLRNLHEPDETLVDWARTRAERLMPELRGHFDFAVTSRWPYMAQVNYPGYYRKAAADLQNLSPESPIQICCDIFSKCGQETSVVHGNAAARALAHSLQRHAAPERQGV